jgi:hypothetical protein
MFCTLKSLNVAGKSRRCTILAYCAAPARRAVSSSALVHSEAGPALPGQQPQPPADLHQPTTLAHGTGWRPAACPCLGAPRRDSAPGPSHTCRYGGGEARQREGGRARTLRAAMRAASSLFAPVQTCAPRPASATVRARARTDAACAAQPRGATCNAALQSGGGPRRGCVSKAPRTILPDLKISAVVFGSRMRMITAANRCGAHKHCFSRSVCAHSQPACWT